jgi:hypothetical protein
MRKDRHYWNRRRKRENDENAFLREIELFWSQMNLLDKTCSTKKGWNCGGEGLMREMGCQKVANLVEPFPMHFILNWQRVDLGKKEVVQAQSRPGYQISRQELLVESLVGAQARG